MRCYKSFEIYDIDAYYLKFLQISPVLLNANNYFLLAKYMLQRILFDKYIQNLISKESLINTYLEIIKTDSKSKKNIVDNNLQDYIIHRIYNFIIKLEDLPLL